MVVQDSYSQLGSFRGSTLKNKVKDQARLSTGCDALDRLMDGGVIQGILTGVSGESGVGKSQLAFQLAALCAATHGPVLFVDSCGTFRPERIVSICNARGIDYTSVLEKILVIRVNTIDEQIDIVNQAIRIHQSDGLKLLILDTLTDAFVDSQESEENSFGKRSQLAIHLNDLSHLASELDISTLITNGIRERFIPHISRVEVGGNTVSQGLHLQIRFGKMNNDFYAETLYPPSSCKRVNYFIKESGLVDV